MCITYQALVECKVAGCDKIAGEYPADELTEECSSPGSAECQATSEELEVRVPGDEFCLGCDPELHDSDYDEGGSETEDDEDDEDDEDEDDDDDDDDDDEEDEEEQNPQN